jgi:hypothetical protein
MNSGLAEAGNRAAEPLKAAEKFAACDSDAALADVLAGQNGKAAVDLADALRSKPGLLDEILGE